MENNTTEKGWAAMRTLLDREMPQKPRRRGLVWWWLLLIPIAGYGSWKWLETSPSSTPIQEETLPKVPVMAAETHLQKFDTDESLAHLSETTPAEKQEPKKQAITRQKYEIRYAPSPRRNDGDIIVDPLPVFSMQADDAVFSSTYRTDAIPVNWPESIVSLKAGAVSTKTLAQSPLQIHPIAKSNKRWSFGATSTISTEQFNAINGFSTGVTVDWSFSRKWGIRSGLLYNIHTPQKKYRPVATVPSTEYTARVEGSVAMMDLQTGNVVNNAVGNPLYSDSLSAQVYIPVTRLERLEIPVCAFWQATRSIKVLGGFSLSRTLLTQADRQNYSGAYVLSLNDQTAADGASKLSTHELDRWNADFSLGAGIRLGESFELALTAKMPLRYKPNAIESANLVNGDWSPGSRPSGSRPLMALSGTLYF